MPIQYPTTPRLTNEEEARLRRYDEDALRRLRQAESDFRDADNAYARASIDLEKASHAVQDARVTAHAYLGKKSYPWILSRDGEVRNRLSGRRIGDVLQVEDFAFLACDPSGVQVETMPKNPWFYQERIRCARGSTTPGWFSAHYAACALYHHDRGASE